MVTLAHRALLRIIALAAVLALLAMAAGAGWLVLTESGLARVVAIVESLEAVHVRVEGARGRLAGPLRADRLEIEAGRVRIDARAIDADYDPSGLLFGRIRVAALDVQELQITLGPSVEPPAERRPQFLPRWLALSVGRVSVDRIVLADSDRTLLEIDGLRASGTVSHARIVLDEVAGDAGLFAVDGSAELRAGEQLGFAGALDFTLGPEHDVAGSFEAEGDLRKVDLSASIREPFEGTVSATLEDVATRLAWRAEARVAELDLGRFIDDPPAGPLSATARGSGSLSRVFLEAHVDGAGLPAAGIDLSTHVTRDGTTLDVELLELAATGAPMSVEGKGRVMLAEPRSFEAEFAWRELRWPFEGEARFQSERGRASLAGWSPINLRIEVTAAAAGLPAADLEAQGILSDVGLLLSQAHVDAPFGRFDGTGYFGFGEDRPWQATLHAEALDLGQFREGLDSDLRFSITASGAGTGRRLAWAAAIEDLSGTMHGQPSSGSGLVRYQPGRIEFERMRLDLGPAQLTADGWTGADTRIRAELRADDLSGFDPDFGGSVDARLEARRAGPKDGLLLDVALRARDLSLGDERAAVLSADALVDLSDATESWVRFRAAGITVGGQEISVARLSLDGRASDHRFGIRVGAGERAVDLEGTGAFVEGVYRASASRITPAGPGVKPWALEQPMNVLAAAERAQLERTCFVLEARKVCLSGEWRKGEQWTASLDTTAFPLQALNVSLPGKPGYEGLLDVDVTLGGVPGQPWTGRGLVRLRDGMLTYLTPSRRQERLSLGVTELRLAAEPDQHRLTMEMNGSELIRMTAEARIERSEDVPLGESPLEGRVELATRQLGLLPLVVPQIDRASGLVDAKLSLAGTAGAPELSGFVSFTDAALDLYAVNLRMHDLDARFDFAGRQVRLDATGGIGEGRFGVSGNLGWSDADPSGRFTFTGERLLVSNLPELRVAASPALEFRIDGRRIDITGSVTVPEARIEPRQLGGAAVPSADEVMLTDGEAVPGTEGFDVSTEVRLILGESVRINAFGLKGRLAGEVLLRTRQGEVPVGSGELQIQDAAYKAYGQELDVDRGRLLFSGGPVADPGIDLRATKDVPGYEVGVIVRGRLRRPEITLWSDPSLPQSQIASLLIVGRTLDSLQTGDRQSLADSSDLATQGGALLAGQIGRYVGLDEVAIETGVDQEALLVLGKFLSPRLYVGYGISLTTSVNTFKLRYTVGDRWILRLEAAEEASVDIEYTIDR